MGLPLLIECVQLCLSSNQISRFLIVNIREKNQVILVFSHGESHQGMVAPETSHILVGCVLLCPHPIILKDSFIDYETGRNQLIYLIFCMEKAAVNTTTLV